MMLTAGGGLCREGQGEEPRVAGRVVRSTTALHTDHYCSACRAVVVRRRSSSALSVEHYWSSGEVIGRGHLLACFVRDEPRQDGEKN